jgi:hypothetical protein
MVIRGMRKVRMVRNVRVPTAKQLALKAATSGD